MAIINWIQAQGFVVVAITGFGPSGHDPTKLPKVILSELDGPTTQYVKGCERWNYGIPAHEIANDDVDSLINWFQGQYRGGKGLKVQAKDYGGFVVNLTWKIRDANHRLDRLFNFHIKVNAGSMDMKTLIASGATGQQKEDAWNDMFPSL